MSNTIDHYTEMILEEMAADSGVNPSYEELRAQVRGSRHIVAGLLRGDPSMDIADLAAAFLIQYVAGL
ncbi:hypothetical protein [Cyanobium sp. Morenito 9A2]|uniref:hypothetical protein n=1 Tax=Cyanobium sp. Morenito 9A2 TaxID=2823718 RepID=UPI0020CCE321|nr:hypothetical protein [Cyanobium sp. Morenito 9A2]MCP9851041.1 hypothetical protein [Cyanobium sp. Morenito 9A2]